MSAHEFLKLADSPVHENLSLPVANDPQRIPEVTALVRDYLQRICAEADDFLNEVRVALEEALTNAVIHGNLGLSSSMFEDREAFRRLITDRRRRDPYRERQVFLTIRVQVQSVMFIVRDEGHGFKPAEVANPLDPENLSLHHGRGLLIIRSFMDEVRHNLKGNEITMIKFRSGAPESS